MEPNNLWVFGYGSLIWNPGFEFKKLVVGHIKGYARKFYQGSDEHRGSPDRVFGLFAWFLFGIIFFL